MSNYGFVYILGNPSYGEDVYKVGCTERSPHSRAEELSKPTGVPEPFVVLCYAEFGDFQSVERQLHLWLKEHRINAQREFFLGGLEYAVSLLYWHPDRLAFTEVCDPSDEAVGWSRLRDFNVGAVCDLSNPFTPKEKVEEPTEEKSEEKTGA